MNNKESKHDKHIVHNLTNKTGQILPPPPQKVRLQGAFLFRSAPYHWEKAVRASLSMGLSLITGWILGHMEWGLLTTMGAFTALYVHNDPYFKRAIKLALVAIGLAACFGIGTLSAESVWSMALGLGIVSALATFLCGAWKVGTPSSFFFILVCAVGTGLPVDPASAPLRAGLALLGGGIAWCISMSGWLVNPHRPEISAVANAYRAIGHFLSTIGDLNHYTARHNAALALRAAEDAVMGGELRWRSTADGNRLFLLSQKANELFLAGISLSVEKKPMHPSIAATVKALADAVSHPKRPVALVVPLDIVCTKHEERLVSVLSDVQDIMKSNTAPLGMHVEIKRPRVLSILLSAISKHSLVLPATLRMSIAVVVATILAAVFGNHRPYWVPLTVSSVLQGATVLATIQRTVQRALGTSVGVILGGGILAIHPTFGLWIVIVMVLQLIIQSIIVRNYAIAVIFITPIPLLLAEMGRSGMSPQNLVLARLSDTWFGCILALAAALLLWHRSSSVRVRIVLSDTIRCEGEFLYEVTGDSDHTLVSSLSRKHRKLQTALVNLHMVYEGAINEITRDRNQELLWPAIVATQRIGYQVLAMSQHMQHTPLSDAERKRILHTFNSLANTVKLGQPITTMMYEIPQYPVINTELRALHHSLGTLR